MGERGEAIESEAIQSEADRSEADQSEVAAQGKRLVATTLPHPGQPRRLQMPCAATAARLVVLG